MLASGNTPGSACTFRGGRSSRSTTVVVITTAPTRSIAELHPTQCDGCLRTRELRRKPYEDGDSGTGAFLRMELDRVLTHKTKLARDDYLQMLQSAACNNHFHTSSLRRVASAAPGTRTTVSTCSLLSLSSLSLALCLSLSYRGVRKYLIQLGFFLTNPRITSNSYYIEH